MVDARYKQLALAQGVGLSDQCGAWVQKLSTARPSTHLRAEGSTAGNAPAEAQPQAKSQQPKTTLKSPAGRKTLPLKKQAQQHQEPPPKPQPATKPADRDKDKRKPAKPAASKSPAARMPPAARKPPAKAKPASRAEASKETAPPRAPKGPAAQPAAKPAPGKPSKEPAPKPAPAKQRKEPAGQPAEAPTAPRAPTCPTRSAKPTAAASASLAAPAGHAQSPTPQDPQPDRSQPAQQDSNTHADPSVPSGSQHAESPPGPLQDGLDSEEYLYNNPPISDAGANQDPAPEAAPSDEAADPELQADAPQQADAAKQDTLSPPQPHQEEVEADNAQAAGADPVLSPSLRLQPHQPSASTAQATQRNDPKQAAPPPAPAAAEQVQVSDRQMPLDGQRTADQPRQHLRQPQSQPQHRLAQTATDRTHSGQAPNNAPAPHHVQQPRQSAHDPDQLSGHGMMPAQFLPQFPAPSAHLQHQALSPMGLQGGLPQAAYPPPHAQAMLQQASPAHQYAQHALPYQGFAGMHTHVQAHAAASHPAGLSMLQRGSDEEGAAARIKPPAAATSREHTPFGPGSFR